MLFGRDSEVESGLYLLRCCNDRNEEFVIGIISEGHGLTPVYRCVGHKLLIGFNREVKIVDSSGSYKTITSDSLFYEFADRDNPSEIIAIFELEIICFSIDGRKQWVHFTDVINDYYIDDNDRMHITTDEGEEIIYI